MQWYDLINRKMQLGGPVWHHEPYREFCVTYLLANNIDIAGKHSYQFGIYAGSSLRRIYEMFCCYQLVPERILAFDSFEGNPEEQAGIPRNIGWSKGSCNVKDLDEHKIDSTQTIIGKILASLPDSDIPIDWHAGFFDQVLTPDFMKLNPKPAFWVDLDVDLYLSSIQVLDFMFQNRLIVSQTLVSFDDWGGTEEYKGGESLAWKEMCEKYSVEANEIHSFRYGDPRSSDFQCEKVFIVKKTCNI